MANQLPWLDDDTLTDGAPDYVALVIEWEDGEGDITQLVQPPLFAPPSTLFRNLVLGVGALGALLLARWGIQRLRHA